MEPEAEATLEAQDPDSLEETGQEPGEPEVVEPVEDAADPEEVAAAADEADSAEQPDGAGQPRDEHGRFAPKTAPPESSPPPAEPSPSGEPFAFRVDGYRVDVEGATEHDGKITIPRDTWDRIVQPKLADRGRIQQREERMSSRIRELESEAEALKERTAKVLGKVDELLGDPERVRAFAARYQTEAPRFRLEVENELLKTQTKRHEQTVQTRQQHDEEREFNESAPTALANAVDLALDELAKDAKVDRKAIVDALWEAHQNGITPFFRVTEGDGSGLDPREHRWGVDFNRVKSLAKPYVDLHKQRAQASQAAKVEQANKAALGKNGKPKAPPVAPASGSPAPGGGDKYPTTREEYEAYKQSRAAELNLPM